MSQNTVQNYGIKDPVSHISLSLTAETSVALHFWYVSFSLG